MEHELKNELSETVEDIKEHLDLFLDLYKLRVAKSISGILVKALKIFIFTNLVLVILIFLSLATAYYIDSRFDTPGIGFAFISLFFTIILLLLWLLRRTLLDQPVIKSVIKFFFTQK